MIQINLNKRSISSYKFAGSEIILEPKTIISDILAIVNHFEE